MHIGYRTFKYFLLIMIIIIIIPVERCGDWQWWIFFRLIAVKWNGAIGMMYTYYILIFSTSTTIRIIRSQKLWYSWTRLECWHKFGIVEVIWKLLWNILFNSYKLWRRAYEVSFLHKKSHLNIRSENSNTMCADSNGKIE